MPRTYEELVKLFKGKTREEIYDAAAKMAKEDGGTLTPEELSMIQGHFGCSISVDIFRAQNPKPSPEELKKESDKIMADIEAAKKQAKP